MDCQDSKEEEFLSERTTSHNNKVIFQKVPKNTTTVASPVSNTQVPSLQEPLEKQTNNNEVVTSTLNMQASGTMTQARRSDCANLLSHASSNSSIFKKHNQKRTSVHPQSRQTDSTFKVRSPTQAKTQQKKQGELQKLPSSLQTTQRGEQSSSKAHQQSSSEHHEQRGLMSSSQQDPKMVSFVKSLQQQVMQMAEKVVQPFSVRRIKRSGYEFYPQRQKMLFDTKRSVNNPSEAKQIQNTLLKQQTEWHVDENYRDYLADKNCEPLVSQAARISQKRQTRRFQNIDRMHNLALQKQISKRSMQRQSLNESSSTELHERPRVASEDQNREEFDPSDLNMVEETYPIPNQLAHQRRHCTPSNLHTNEHARRNLRNFSKMLPRTLKSQDSCSDIDVFNLTQGTEQMRREKNRVCYLGECEHKLRMPKGRGVTPLSDSQTFYSAQLQAVTQISKAQKKAIQMAPELSEVYLAQMQRKEEKYAVDWDISGQDQNLFEHFAQNNKFVSRQPTKMKLNSRSSTLLYKKSNTETSETQPFQLSQEVRNLKALRRSRFFNEQGQSSQQSKGSYFLLQNRKMNYGKFSTTYMPQQKLIDNIKTYCKLANMRGYANKEIQKNNQSLPEQPKIKVSQTPDYSVEQKDLVYVNSFEKLVDECLVKPSKPTKQNEVDPEIINLVKKQSHLYKKKAMGGSELPFSDMQNKLDLFQMIDKIMGGGDLQWLTMLDTEIVKYQATFQEELTQMSQEIRSKLQQDLEKHKNFYQQKQEGEESSSRNVRRSSLLGASFDSASRKAMQSVVRGRQGIKRLSSMQIMADLDLRIQAREPLAYSSFKKQQQQEESKQQAGKMQQTQKGNKIKRLELSDLKVCNQTSSEEKLSVSQTSSKVDLVRCADL